MLELTFVLLLIPLLISLLVQFVSLGQALYEQPRIVHQATPQLIVRKIMDSRDCHVDQGRLRGTFVKEDGTTWPWTLKQIDRNLVMVGDGGGNFLFLRGVEDYRVETVGIGYHVTWDASYVRKEKFVACMRRDSL